MFIAMVGVVAALSALVIAAALPSKALFGILTGLNIVQPRVGGLNLPVPIFSAASVLLAPVALFRGRRYLLRAPTSYLAALVVISLVASMFSVDPGMGLRESLILLNFLIAVLLGLDLAHNGCNPVVWAYRCAAPFAAVGAASVALFRLNPALELSYLRSEIAGFLLGDSARLIFSTLPNNATLSYKAGGIFFVNANQASLFYGIFALICLYVWIRNRSKLAAILSLASAAAIVLTGSKTGILILASLPILLFFAARLPRISKHPLALLGLVIAVPLVATVTSFLLDGLSQNVDTASGRVDSAEDTWEVRIRFWEVAGLAFQQSPFTGLSFGGWDQFFASSPLFTTFNRVYPPHNLFIAQWAATGLVGVVLLTLIAISVIRRQLFAIRSSGGRREAYAEAALLCIMVWLLVHGSGDNTSIFGTVHSVTLVGAVIASSSSHWLKSKTDATVNGALKGAQEANSRR